MINTETIKLNEKAIKIASAKIKRTYTQDKMIMQAVISLNDEEKMINTEYERLSDMYWRYYPEALSKINDINKLIKITKQDRKETAKELGLNGETMGYELTSEEIKLIREYALVINEHLKAQTILEEFIKKNTEKLMPETSKTATPILTARLMTLAKGLKELMLMPASTIQILGAEKALFRHLRSNAKPPKHGIILQHQSVQTSKTKGKAARQLACKISMAVKIDYFRGAK